MSDKSGHGLSTVGLLFAGVVLIIVLSIALPMISGAVATEDEHAARAAVAYAHATRQAIDNERARIDNQIAQSTSGARSFALGMLYVGGALVGIVLAVGLTAVGMVWLERRARLIWPNATGLYPVVERAGLNGDTIYHDANRNLGPTAIYHQQTTAGRLMGDKTAPSAAYPLPADDVPTARQIATQAQVGQVAAAQNRWPNIEIGAAAIKPLASRHRNDDDRPRGRMAEVSIVNDAAQVESTIKRYHELPEPGSDA